MTEREAAIKCLDLFDRLRPDDVTDPEWLMAKVTFGLINKASKLANSMISTLSEGYTIEEFEAEVDLLAMEYKPRIKKWIIEEMR